MQKLSEPVIRFSSWVAKITAACALVFSLGLSLITWGWWLVEPRAVEAIDNILPGARQLPQAIKNIDRRLRDVERVARDLRIIQDVAEYDREKSFVRGPCVRNQPCSARFRVRRTPAGLHCKVKPSPETLPIVVNHLRDPIRTKFVDFKPVNIGLKYVNLDVDFKTPGTAALGGSDLHIRMHYHQCQGRDDQRDITEASISLPFEIVD